MEQLVQFFRNLGTVRLVVVSSVLGITLLFFSLIIGQLQSTNMEVLYNDVDPSDVSTIVARLDADNIPYEASNGGRTILVPETEVDRLRLVLAGDGLAGGVVGKEIFDENSSFGRTSFELNVNFVRAVEGELSRTINFLNNVSETRVHIVMPERRPLMRNPPVPTASILIRPRGGGPSRQQAEAIQQLVAAAVPGLDADKVTITDTSGRLLSVNRGDETLAQFAGVEEARIAKENLYRNKIEGLIASRVGQSAVRAEVSVDMEMNRTTESRTVFDPDTQVVLSQTLIEERSSEDQNRGTVTVGNNLPDAEPQEGGGDSSQSSRTEETSNFENSKVETVTVREPGEVKNIRVAVLVDGIRTFDEVGSTVEYEDRSDDEIEQLRDLIVSALPYDQERGDSVVVQSMRFADPPPFESLEPPFQFFGLAKSDVLQLLQWSGLILVAALLLLTVVRPLVGSIADAIPKAPPPPDPALLEAQARAEIEDQQPPALLGPSGLTADVLERAASGDADAIAQVKKAQQSGSLTVDELETHNKIDVAQVEGRIGDNALSRVAALIKQSPEDSVSIIRGWLYAAD